MTEDKPTPPAGGSARINLLREWIIDQQQHCQREIAHWQEHERIGEMAPTEPEYPEYSAIQARIRRLGAANQRWLKDLAKLLAETPPDTDDPRFAAWRSAILVLEEEIHKEAHIFLLSDEPEGRA